MRRCTKRRPRGIARAGKYVRDYFTAAPVVNALFLAVNLVIALLPSGVTFLTAAVTERVGAGDFAVGFALGLGALIALIAVNQALYYVSDLLVSYSLQKAHLKLRGQFMTKAASLPLVTFEESGVLDRMHRLDVWLKEYRITHYFLELRTQAVNLVTVVSLAVSLAVFSPYLMLIAVAAALPALLIRLVEGKKFFEFQRNFENLERNRAYFWKLFRDKTAVREMTGFGAAPFFLAYGKETDLDMTTRMYRFTHSYRLKLLGVFVFVVAGYVGGIVCAAALVRYGLLAVSGFSAAVSSQQSFSNAVAGFFDSMGYLRETDGYVREYYDFLALPEEARADAGDAFTGIRCEDVTFAYPDGHTAVSGVSFFLPAGKHLAVVGENGSGKTTLVKLLTGAYAPSSGTVTACGRPVYGMSPDRHGFTVQPQQYIKYKGTVAENIFLSDPARADDAAAVQALFDGSALSSEPGLTPDSRLGREYDGRELSEGQWQQLAFLRASFRRADVMLLDEPTGAVDPHNEHRLLAGFMAAIEGRTAVIVTHRLSLCRFADEILFMEDGRVTERGTHDELMARRGGYFRMFSSQLKWYE